MNGIYGFMIGRDNSESALRALRLAGLPSDRKSFTGARFVDLAELNIDDLFFVDPIFFTSAMFHTGTNIRAIEQPGGYDTWQPWEAECAMQRDLSAPTLVGTALLNGETHQRIVYALDPVEQRQEERDLRRAKEAAEDLIRTKDTFLAMVSHELRTPLTPAFGAIDMLMDDQNMSEENRMLLEIVRENIEIEMRLIEDLQEMTRLSNGKLSLQLGQIDAHDVIRKAIAVCMSDFERKNLHITVNLEASNTTVDGDPIRLQQVVWNLLKNAIKFTPEGGSICISTRNDLNGHLSIEIADTGRGIEEQTLPIIFNAFEQGSKTITHDFGGLGLGLAITRMLVEMHGGRIYATSEGADRGAVFTVEMNVLPFV